MRKKKDVKTPLVIQEPEDNNLDNILSDTTLPEVNEEAIQSCEKRNTETEIKEKQDNDIANLKDRLGRGFNADVHKHDALGQPIPSAKGLLQIKPGRKKGTLGKNPELPIQNGLEPQHAGFMAADLQFTLGTIVFGADGQPIINNKEDERATLAFAWGKYFDEHDIKDVPAWLLIMAVSSSYVGRRLAMPEPKRRVSNIFKNTFLRLRNVFKRKVKKEEKENDVNSTNEVNIKEV